MSAKNKKIGGANVLVSTGYAWKFRGRGGRWVLCSWAEPTKERLLWRNKPSPEAVPVRVRLRTQ